ARGFEAILTSGGMEVVDICTDLGRITDSFARRQPEVAILDMAVAPLHSVLIELRRLSPTCQLLVWPRQISEREAKELVRFGARGLLPNDVTPELLIATIRMLDSFPQQDGTPSGLVKQVCNVRERQILSLVGRGMKNDEIATLVRVDARTVDEE